MQQQQKNATALPPDSPLVALAGNPNVGKSTLFNGLTGLRQHTGNWAGKTVGSARGVAKCGRRAYTLVDIPGTYSLLAHSAEEEVARNCICFGGLDAVIVVCDATCLLRNLNLVLQILEITPRVIVCINLLDEAARKGIEIDLPRLAELLGVPVVGTVAQDRESHLALLAALDHFLDQTPPSSPLQVRYPDALEEALAIVTPALAPIAQDRVDCRWLALRLLEQDASLIAEITAALGESALKNAALIDALARAQDLLAARGVDPAGLPDCIVSAIMRTAESVAECVCQQKATAHSGSDRRVDRVLTSRRIGYPVMLLLLAGVLFLTVAGANYPSALLSQFFAFLQIRLSALLSALQFPALLQGALIDGVYRTLTFVVSVMLPPMAIFFPLFTLLEDVGYLPRIAFNLDKPFQKCRACGKQALCMCMGLGCNAVGVTGCRIIDSPRERLLAVLTNSFVPCNGKFAPPRQGKESCFRRPKNRTRKSNFP